VRTPTDGVPCSDEALAVIDAAQKHQRDGYLFANAKKGVISDAAMSQHMKRAELGCTPHGFRTSVREWLDEKTDARYEVAEMMLGHKVGSSVECAYRRADYLEKRRELLERWAAHVTSRVGKNYRARVRL
jgi:integrase